MKRKIFLAMLACVVLCAFLAICASAATTNEFGTVETSSTIDLTGMATDTDLRVVLYDGTEYHTYPAQYIVTSATDITLDFTKINAAFGKNYSTENDSVIRIEIPRHVKTIVSGVFNYGKNDNLVEVFFPAGSTVTTLKWGCFEQNKGLQKINLPASLTTLDGQNNFAKCSSLKYVTFDEGYSISYIPLNCFQSCSSLEYIKFPNCVTEIRGGAFGSCSKLKTIIFGDSLQTMGGPMSDCSTSGSVWYLPASFYSSSVTSTPPSNMFHWAGAQTNGVSGTSNNPRNITFVYTGTKAEAEALQARFKAADATTGEGCVGLSRLYDATLCTEEEYEQLTGKKIGEIATGYYLVYGYNKCKAFYENEHNYGDVNSCTADAKCERNCGHVVKSQFTEHKMVKSFTYANGFDSNGVYSCICENASYCIGVGASETYVKSEVKAPIIKFKGYSVPENTTVKGINAGFSIDKVLLELYNDINTVDASLTLFMVNSKSGNADISKILDGATLELADGVKGINVKISSINYTNISIEVRGFDDSTNDGDFYTLNLITAIAVKTNKGIHYVQAGLKNSPNTTLSIDGVDFNIVSASKVYGKAPQA